MLAGPIVGPPGVGNTYQANYRRVFYGPIPDVYLPGGKTIDGTYARDPNNGVTTVLRAGTLLGKVTSTGFYANSVIGVLTNAEATGSTAYETSAASVLELIRRVGATGSVKMTGPPTTNGTSRTLTVAYTAASGTSITVTAAGANMVQRVDLDIASSGGSLRLQVSKVDGSLVTTADIAWSATDATYLASINSALDTATGVSGGIVATAISAVDTDLGFKLTYSGTGYAGLTWPMVVVEKFPTSSTLANYSTSVAAVDARFVAGSLIQPTDGSETCLTFVPDGFGLQVTDSIGGTAVYAQDHKLPIGGTVDFAQLLPAMTDTGLKAQIKGQLRNASAGNFVFSDGY